MLTVVLLLISNIFMTFAWYGHLRYKDRALWVVILVSWGIAFFEYCFQVPANRLGSNRFSGIQLKMIQEVITLVVFSVFSVLYLRERLGWNHLLGFALLLAAVYCVFGFGPGSRADTSPVGVVSTTIDSETLHGD
ncbi:MAG: DMT family protein [Isosphaeraceae bacterium]|nr:DMT family protein [Isosphaeraceae bacterium]